MRLYRRAWAQGHRWIGVVAVPALLLLTLTGFLLQNPGWLEPAPEPAVVAADPDHPSRILRAEPGLLLESLDGGQSWSDLPLMDVPLAPCRLLFDSGGEVWLLGADDLLRSRDGGRIWQRIPLPEVPAGGYRWRDLAILDQGGVVLVGEAGAWSLPTGDGSWSPLWSAPSGGAAHRLVRRLHTGHWGFATMPTLYQVLSILILATGISGTVLLKRRRRP